MLSKRFAKGPADHGGALSHVRPEVAVVDLTGDLTETYWTTAEAAEAAQVDPNVVRNWKYRGLLMPAKSDWRGRPLYRAVDVIRAEAATRKAARRSYPVAA